MAHLHHRSSAVLPRRHRVALAVALACLGNASVVLADNATLPAVTVSGATAAPVADVSGFGDQPLATSPFSATVIDSNAIADTGARRLKDLYRLDASVTDAYNAAGYYDYASVRGFVIDNTYNFRREGLPISAETSLPLDHLERVELLKGTSGIQAGTSAPGGLFNAVVKRPGATPLRQFRTELTSDGNLLGHLDVGGRLGDGTVGYRVNVAAERLNTAAAGTEGKRHLLAVAMDARLSADSLLEGEFEVSRRRQASVPGLSLLGDALPPADPRLNINTQPWSQPVDFRNASGSLRFTQAINRDWNWQAQLGTQRLRTDDFLAYPFGCFDAGSGIYYADRYCPNGDFDLYDFRSLGERRSTQAAQWKLNGQFNTGALQHRLTTGVLVSRFTLRGQPQADNNAAAGTGNIITLPGFAPVPVFGDPFTNRTERSTELFVTDVIRWNEAWQTWLGLRHTRIDRQSIRTDGSRATDYEARFTTPWIAATVKLDGARTAYASWGQGIESEVAPGRARYTNQGEPLPALKSRQWEIGLKSETAQARWQITWFNTTRPVAGDIGACGAAATCTRIIDGDARHRGLELGYGRTVGAWSADSSLTWIDAERRGVISNPALTGKRPTNVPQWVLRANLGYRLAALPGATVGAHLSHEGRRAITPDNQLELGSWTRVDVSLRREIRFQGQPASWTVGLNNVFDRRYFAEAPFQYDHIYLFPGAPRTLRVAFETAF